MEEKMWNLDDILKLEDFEEYFEETKKKGDEIDMHIKLLSPTMSSEDFCKVLDYEEMMGERFARLGWRPELMEATNQKDEKAKLLKSRVTDLALAYSKKARRISHWIKGKKVEGLETLDDDNAKRLFGCRAELEYSLNYSRLAAKHTLDEDKEDIIINKDVNGVEVLNDLRTLIETEFEYKFEPEGEEPRIIKTLAELTLYTRSPKRSERKAAYKSVMEKHRDNLEKFFAIYQAVVKDWGYETKLRGYKSPISMRNFANRIPDEAIETLLQVCRENNEIFKRYFRFKAKELGLEKLDREDIYAPLESKKKKYSFEESWKLVKDTWQEFAPGFRERAEKIANEGHIDIYPKVNKVSGAFCGTVDPKITPYVLLNHTDEEKDVSTLAHELGHGIHSLYANNLPGSVQHASLPLAETASTMGEMVLFERLYETETDMKVKKSMLSEKIADSYASIIRQNYFVIFEIRAHEAISKGVTAKELGKMWLETLNEQFGEAVNINPLFENEWAYIPHIVNTPFYCYAYNFGELLSYALYANYKKEGKEFIPKLEKILSSGGSRDPNEVLMEVGVDVKNRDFWQGSFEVIKGWMDELENM